MMSLKIMRWIMLLGLIGIFVQGVAARTESDTPLYGVAYPLSGGIGVTTFYSDQHIHTQILEDAEYDDYLQHYLKPIWSSDGRFLYALRPSKNDSMTWLHVYDVMSDTFTPVVDFPVLNADRYPDTPEVVEFSLSPDRHYIWAGMSEVGRNSYLLDLQNGSLTNMLPCPSYVSDWLPKQAVVLPFYCGYGEPQLADLATGTTKGIFSYSDMPDGLSFYPPVMRDKNDIWLWLTAYGNDHLYVVNGGTGEQIIYTADDFWIAPDGSMTALLNKDSHLLRIVGDPHQVVDTGAIGTVTKHYEQDGKLTFWHYAALDNDQYAITYTVLTADSRTDTLVYQGAVGSWDNITYSPYDPYLLIENRDTTQLFAQNGLVWSSDDAFSGYSLLDFNWSQNGEWLYFTAYQPDDGSWKGVGVDLQSGAVFEPPVEGNYRVISASSDGAWWILMHADENQPYALAFHYPTGTLIDLMAEFPPDKRPAYTWGGYDGLLPEIFLWSPVAR